MVPTGWDSWGKINVLRDGFEAEKVGEAWESSLARLRPVSGRMEEDMVKDEDEQGIEEMWSGVVPDLDQGLRVRLQQGHLGMEITP
jgi:dynein light intermediate chain 1